MTTKIGIPYSNPDGFPLTFDWFRPDGEAVRPCVICIFGGGWVSGDPTKMHDVAARLAQEGFAAACPDYRLAPQHLFPAACDDLSACVSFLKAHADELKIDPTKIAALGHSAGGHLAAWVGLKEHLQAVVDISGVADMMGPDDYYTEIGVALANQFFGGTRSEFPDRYRAADLTLMADAHAPPFLLIHGEDDDLVPIVQSKVMHDALCRNGTPVKFHRYPQEGHSFSYPAWEEIARQIVVFLKETLAT